MSTALQNKDCPICSWVHRPEVSEDAYTAVVLESFSPKPKAKGIVYYSDRMAALETCSSPFMTTMAAIGKESQFVKSEVIAESVAVLADHFDEPLEGSKKSAPSEQKILVKREFVAPTVEPSSERKVRRRNK